MNIFSKIMADQTKAERSLGNKLGDQAAIDRRMNFFAALTNGKGFRQPPSISDGKRAERKRVAKEAATRQIRKEREIGTDPLFHRGSYLNLSEARKQWRKRYAEWNQANES